MKRGFALFLLATLIIPSSLAQPALAHDCDDARDHYSHALRERRDAAEARAEARADRAAGHSIRGWLHSRHAAHERARARKHMAEARWERRF